VNYKRKKQNNLNRSLKIPVEKKMEGKMKQKTSYFTLLLLLILLVYCFQLNAGITGKITGTVKDENTGEPLPGVNVMIEGTVMGAATNLKGIYVILNIPPEEYSITTSMMGYQSKTVTKVKVRADLTTRINFNIAQTLIPVEGITIIDIRPIIEKDLTESRHIVDADESKHMPVEAIQDVVAQQAGVIEGHIRGGREGEVIYMMDGVAIVDPLTNRFDSSIPQFGVQETAVYTGGFSAEYGNAQSGVVNIVMKEGGKSQSGSISYQTNDFRGMQVFHDYLDYGHQESANRLDFGLGGPEPLTTYLLPLMNLSFPGKGVRYYLAGEMTNTLGRFPHDDETKRTYQGKISYIPATSIKMGFGMLKHSNDYHYYDVRWKYILDHLPDIERDSDNYSFFFNQMFGSKTYYEFKISRYKTKRLLNVFEDGTFDINGDGIIDDRDKDGIDDFADENRDESVEINGEESGIYWPDLSQYPFTRAQDVNKFYKDGYYRIAWQDDDRETWTARLDLTSQVTEGHQIKTGFEGKYYELFYYRADMASGGNVYMDKYKNYPHSTACYIQDKMEFEGIIVNAGFRFDYFNAKTSYPKDKLHPVPDSLITSGGVIKDPVETDPKFQLSPRIGVSHPITERDVLHFTYGHYFQTPPLYILYRNGNYDFSGAFPMVGNPNIDQEKTVSYETGVKHAITNYAVIDVTGFYKDISGLTDTESIYYTAANYYTIYRNTDYGNVRGIEVTFWKRPEGLFSYWSGSIHYTYSVAKGKSSTTRQNYDYVWAGYVVPTREYPLDWDQPHTLNVNVDFRVPRDEALFGIRFLNNFGFNIITNYGSGLPWTPPSRTRIQLINAERRPWTLSTNVKINKDFTIFNKFSLSFMTYIYNLFNRSNLQDIANAEWYKTFGDPEGQYKDETVWSEGRLIRLGVELNWMLGK